MKFPDFFLAFSWQSANFYWLFAAPKYDILTFEGIHVHHTDTKELLQWSFGKRYMICHFDVPYQLNYGLIYKMSKHYRNTFPNFLAFLAGICGTHWANKSWHHRTVKIWNEGFKLISTPFFLTFSWLLGEFQNFLTYIKIYPGVQDASHRNAYKMICFIPIKQVESSPFGSTSNLYATRLHQ